MKTEALDRDLSSSGTLLLSTKDSFCEAELLCESEAMLNTTNWKIIIIMKSQNQLNFLASSITFGITQPHLPLEVWEDFGHCLFPFFLSIKEAKIKYNSLPHEGFIFANLNDLINLSHGETKECHLQTDLAEVKARG